MKTRICGAAAVLAVVLLLGAPAVGAVTVAVIVTGLLVTVAIIVAAGWLAWREGPDWRTVRERQAQDAPGRPVRVLPVSRVPPAERPALEDSRRPAIEPSRVMEPGQLAEMLRQQQERRIGR